MRHLPSRRICRTMLDSGMSVAEVSEIMDVFGCKKRTSSQRVNRCITPLNIVSNIIEQVEN